MLKHRALPVVGILALFGAGVAFGQAITSQTLTGNEVVTAAQGGPGGSGLFVPVSQLRNAQGVATTALTTGTFALTGNIATLLTTAVVSGALTITTPALPWDGEIFELANGSGGNNTATVTLTATGSQTVTGGAVATQANQTSTEWRYVLATNTWYRIR